MSTTYNRSSVLHVFFLMQTSIFYTSYEPLPITSHSNDWTVMKVLSRYNMEAFKSDVEYDDLHSIFVSFSAFSLRKWEGLITCYLGEQQRAKNQIFIKFYFQDVFFLDQIHHHMYILISLGKNI